MMLTPMRQMNCLWTTFIKTMPVVQKQEKLWKSIWSRVRHPQGLDWDWTPKKIWTFKKGEAFDYTNARIARPPIHEFFAPVKPEGHSIDFDVLKWVGAEKIGNWWSVTFQFRKLQIRFRYRSWTTNIFFISWE